MSKEINALRKSGQLDEAYALAQHRLKEASNDIWILRACSWVLYDLIKQAISDNEHENILGLYDEVTALGLDREEQLLWENLARQMMGYIWTLSKEGQACRLLKLLEHISPLVWNAPSSYYSSVVQAVVRCFKEFKGVPSFEELALLEWVDPDLFTSEDYQPKQLEGQKYALKPIAESYYNSYAKAILGLKDRDRAQALYPKMQELALTHPKYIWCGYNAAKLMLLSGSEDQCQLRQQLIPVVKAQSSQFWAWDAFADLYERNSDERFACLSRAMLCPLHSPEMTVNLRKEIVKELYYREYYGEARYEIEMVIKLRQEQGWREDPTIMQCLSKRWYVDAKPKNPKAVYQQYEEQANELIFGIIDKPQVLITSINREKKLAHTLTEKGQRGYFSFVALRQQQFELGKLYELSLTKEPQEFKDGQCRYIVKSIKALEDKNMPKLVRTISGTVRLIKSGAGFVEEIYIPGSLVQHYRLVAQDFVTVVAYRSWDKKKEQWGWSVRDIYKLTSGLGS